MGDYQATFARSLKDPDGFWAAAAEALEWERRWDRVLDDSHPPFYRWFTGGRLNTCHNAVDRHVAAGRGEQLAIIYDSPVTETIRTLTFAELRDQVARCAGMLRQQGVGPGDRVIVYMPMVPEALDRDARLRAHRRHPFGRVRRLRGPRARRPGSTTPSPSW